MQFYDAETESRQVISEGPGTINPLLADAITIPAPARSAFHPPPAANKPIPPQLAKTIR